MFAAGAAGCHSYLHVCPGNQSGIPRTDPYQMRMLSTSLRLELGGWIGSPEPLLRASLARKVIAKTTKVQMSPGAHIARLLQCHLRSWRLRGEAYSLEDQTIPVGCLSHSLQRDPALERDESSLMMRGEPEQIRIGKLSRAVDSG